MKSLQSVSTANAPQAIGPYSQAIQADQLIFVSGQLPIDPETGKLITGDIGQQTHQVLCNIQAILKACGSDFQHVVRAELFLKDLKNFDAVNQAYGHYFSAWKPARQTVEVSRLPKDAEIEISCIAVMKD